jgi:hypothetical protein
MKDMIDTVKTMESEDVVSMIEAEMKKWLQRNSYTISSFPASELTGAVWYVEETKNEGRTKKWGLMML